MNYTLAILTVLWVLEGIVFCEPQNRYRKPNSQPYQNQAASKGKPEGRLFFDGLSSLLPVGAAPVRRRYPVSYDPVSYDPCIGRNAPQGRFFFPPANVYNVRRYPVSYDCAPSASYYDTYADPRPRPLRRPLPQTVNDGLLNFISIFGKPPSYTPPALSSSSHVSEVSETSSLVETPDTDDIFDPVTENSPVLSDPAPPKTRNYRKRSRTYYRKRPQVTRSTSGYLGSINRGLSQFFGGFF